jgi:hypothetical protein
MSEPIDHHYVAIFYLSRWASDDQKVCRFSRPHGPQVKWKRVAPKGTAFEPRLYEMEGVPGNRAQFMEADFMAKLDSAASEALVLLEWGASESEWSSTLRRGWSRFIFAQMLRAPQDITQLKSSVTQVWEAHLPKLEQDYAERRQESDPKTLREYLEQQSPGHANEFIFEVARSLMHHEDVCQLIDNMHWLVFDIPKEAYPLLTSDRPVWMTATLSEEDAFLVMPIGPRKLFTATTRLETQARLRARRRSDQVKGVNKLIVQHAVEYVYGEDAAMLPFVQKHMATKRHSSLLERQAVSQGLGVVAVDSPSHGLLASTASVQQD